VKLGKGCGKLHGQQYDYLHFWLERYVDLWPKKADLWKKENIYSEEDPHLSFMINKVLKTT